MVPLCGLIFHFIRQSKIVVCSHRSAPMYRQQGHLQTKKKRHLFARCLHFFKASIWDLGYRQGTKEKEVRPDDGICQECKLGGICSGENQDKYRKGFLK